MILGLGDVYTEVLEATHHLHRGPTDHKRMIVSVVSVQSVKCHQLSKPKATVARNQRVRLEKLQQLPPT